MMHGMGMMGGFGLLWILIPVVLGIAVVSVLRNREKKRIDPSESRRELRQGSDALDQTIFRLARRHNGRLTVSDVVVESRLSVREAEAALNDLVDGTHVTMEITENGSVVYEFPEL